MNCHAYCKTCTGPSVSECLSCQLGYYYHENECHTTCPDGTYKNFTAWMCS